MNSMWIKTLALAAAAVGYSHAIFGIGAQWAPAPSLEVKAGKGTVTKISATDSVTISQDAVSGLNGFGVKLWIDALPFIDLEAGSNVQYGLYDVVIGSPAGSKKLEFDLGVPTVDKPAFARIVSDVTILYPFLKLPPLISILKLSAGAGMTHVLATEVLSAKFAQDAVTAAKAKGKSASNTTEVSTILVDAIKDKGLTSGVGFHLELSAKAKVPVIPIGVFADLKYHFLSSMPKSADANSMTMELGAALAF